MKQKTNFKAEVLKYLKKGRTLTVLQAFERWGSFKLSSRISDLKREGYKFKQTPVKHTTRFGLKTEFLQYKLLASPK